LHGKLLGRPVANLLGGARESVPIMMALGYYRAENEFELLRQEYASLAAQGFRRFKMMAGGASLERDLQRVAEISDVLPADATLAIDVNGAWSSAAEAHALLDGIEREIAFIEDPFMPDNEGALREFRQSSDIPVAIGEWESGRARFSYLMANDLVDIVRIDATAAGGITEWLRIASIASERGTRILPHYFPEIHVHLAAVTASAEAIEAVPRITGADNFDELAVLRPWVEAPATAVADRPGLGIGWDARLISRLSGRAWGDPSEGEDT
jgi:L-alanine-DL-glutamate epimerase-like enolase superfamily enzyme